MLSKISPSDFVQIKGRGTRTYTFKYNYKITNNGVINEINKSVKKENFKLFDFFANCEYFETEYPYDEVLKLPESSEPNNDQPEMINIFKTLGGDGISLLTDYIKDNVNQKHFY